jgi:hypothetical protein
VAFKSWQLGFEDLLFWRVRNAPGVNPDNHRQHMTQKIGLFALAVDGWTAEVEFVPAPQKDVKEDASGAGHE